MIGAFFFLQEDLDELDKEIQKLIRQRAEAGQEIGKSCQESSETFHDNFHFDEATREFQMHSIRLKEYKRMREAALVVVPKQTGHVEIGTLVTIEEEDGTTLSFRVGSYRVFCDPNAVSYKSPLAKIVLGARIGDIRTGQIHGKTKKLVVLNLE